MLWQRASYMVYRTTCILITLNLTYLCKLLFSCVNVLLTTNTLWKINVIKSTPGHIYKCISTLSLVQKVVQNLHFRFSKICSCKRYQPALLYALLHVILLFWGIKIHIYIVYSFKYIRLYTHTRTRAHTHSLSHSLSHTHARTQYLAWELKNFERLMLLFCFC